MLVVCAVRGVLMCFGERYNWGGITQNILDPHIEFSGVKINIGQRCHVVRRIRDNDSPIIYFSPKTVKYHTYHAASLLHIKCMLSRPELRDI